MQKFQVIDDDGFLALVVPGSYRSFVDEDWEFEQLNEHFCQQMGERALLIWRTSTYGGDWLVEVHLREHPTTSFRHFEGALRVQGGSALLTTYTSLTMAAQFADEKLPADQEKDQLITLPDGEYRVRISQLFDPEEDEPPAPHFVIEFLTGKVETPPAIPWFEG